MKFIRTDMLPDVVMVEPDVFTDARGYFCQTWSRPAYHAAGLAETFVQDNVSRSQRGVLRGLHFQNPLPQAKLVYVLEGCVLDVAVDIRRGSPTFGRWHGVELSAANHRQLFIPEGFAHGFCVLSESALVAYKCSQVYRPDCDAAIRWSDPEIGIEWPIRKPILSVKDESAPFLQDIMDQLPRYADNMPLAMEIKP